MKKKPKIYSDCRGKEMTLPEHAKMPDMRIQKKYGNIPTHAIVGDKEYDFRSKAEIKLAKYLQLLKEMKYIKDWEYEAMNFKFPDSSFLVDFTVRNNDDTFEHYEYKGYVEANTRKKLQLLNKYFPQAQITMVMGNKEGIKKLGARASGFCKRVCLLKDLTKGIL
jgi:hypothetical protein